jgi:type II secretion system protein H
MPTSATGVRETRGARPPCLQRTRDQRGLSLIELLVAVAIVAVLASVAVLALGGADAESRAEREAQRIAALIDLACERAELGGRSIGVHLARTRLAFSAAEGEDWRLETVGDLRPREFDAAVALDLALDGRALALEPEVSLEPQAVCTPAGELTPLVLGVAVGGAPRRSLSAGPEARAIVDARDH